MPELTRRDFLRTSAGAAALSACSANRDQRPNVVVILTDDQRWDAMSCIENRFFQHMKTPHMDRLAAEGACFTNAFVTNSLCSPSRASFLSGLYAHKHGVINNFTDFPSETPNYPAILKAQGYETAYIGKWHMGEQDDSPRPGFTHWVAMKGQGEAVNPNLNVNGTRRVDTGYVTDVLTDHAVDFISRSRGRPFLLFLAHKALHPNIMQRDDGSTAVLEDQPEGFIAAPRHRGRYANTPVPRRET